MIPRSTWILTLVPMLAYSAEQTARTLEGDSTTSAFWYLLLAVQVLSLIGHIASSLGEWAQWHDTSGSQLDIKSRRYRLMQGGAVSILAGNIAYFGGYYLVSIGHIEALISSAMAAWAGDRFLTPLMERFTGRMKAIGS